MSELTEVIDVFFNGRPAHKVDGKQEVDWQRLIDKGVSHVRIGGKKGKVYRVEVTEVKPK
jgi:hypothetical protein